MKFSMRRAVIAAGLLVAGWILIGELWPTSNVGPVGTAEAVIGRPRTPVSYAGVARRSTVGVGAPGAGVRGGVGVGARGVGTRPGVGAGAAGPGVRHGTPANRGGPVNRVGRR